MKATTNNIALVTIATCLLVLATDRIYGRFFDKMPSRVYVMGGDMSVSVDGGHLESVTEVERLNYAVLAPLNDSLEVEVKGGKLDYPTDWRGNLIVSPNN